MALFSTTLATQNFTKIVKRKPQLYPKDSSFPNFEYKTFKKYRDAGGVAKSLDEWKGADAKWLETDRIYCRDRWRTAVSVIITQQMENRLMPFEQVADFYRYTQKLVSYRKHQTKWLLGAYYLVSDLADAYEQGLTFDMISESIYLTEIYTNLGLDNLRNLLSALNRSIANFAITKFYDLLFGKYRNLPRTGSLAWKFDKQFVVHEQGPVAFEIYKSGLYDEGRDIENDLFNRKGIFIAYDLIKNAIYIPVFPNQYNSNLTLNDGVHPRYGEEARIEVPLAMLYPDQSFYNDDAQSDIPGDSFFNDPKQGTDPILSFKDSKFGKTLKRAQNKMSLPNAKFDSDTKILFDYMITNRLIKSRFNKIRIK